MESESVPVI